MRYIAQRTKSSFLILADNNFGMFKEDAEAARAMTRAYNDFGYPLQVYSATAKTRYDRVVEAVKELEGRMPVTVAVQSLDDQVLKNIKRKNLPLENLLEVTRERYYSDTRSRSEMILALPGDSRDKHIGSLCDLMDAGVSFLLDYTLILLDGAEMSMTGTRRKFGMQTKYRLNHRCYGNYQFGGKRIRAAEIEEVVVGLETLSFEDYLECRLFYLTVGVFYLDEILFELVEFLKAYDVKPSTFIRHIHGEGRRHFSDGLKELYVSFDHATRKELWDSEEELVEFIKADDRTSADVRKMGGYNVIFFHRATGFLELVDDIIDVAFKCAGEVLPDEALLDHATYLSQLKTYMRLRKRNVFDYEQVLSRRFDYDFRQLQAEGFVGLPSPAETPLDFEFFHTDEQVSLFGTFNPGREGAARALAKLSMSRMYRTVSAPRQRDLATGEKSAEFRESQPQTS